MNLGIPSKQFDIWSRLYRRFKLEPGPAGEPRAAVGTTIMPVTQVDQLLQTPIAEKVNLDLTGAGSDLIPGYTVPEGRRATILFVQRENTTGNSFIEASVGGVRIALQGSGTARSFLSDEMPLAVPLDQSDAIGLFESGNAGDGSITFEYIGLEEEAY